VLPAVRRPPGPGRSGPPALLRRLRRAPLTEPCTTTRRRLVLAERNLTYQLLVPDLRGALSMLYIEMPTGFSNEHASFSHPGEEVAFVLEGRLEINIGGTARLLEKGDSIRFASITEHWYRTFDEEVVVITAMTPPSF
jgi:quercetin dioxygenase-like cupin family protein